MKTQIISTKLFIPTPGPELISRPRLFQRLENGSRGKLTLISAQAGFGKTTLLSEWIRQCDKLVCWLSLDERDNDVNRFLHYLITALQKVDREFGEDALLELQSSQPLETEILLTGLINQITAANISFVVVLDDYHVITEPEIQQVLLFLLDHLPPQLHVMISSRSDPPWPLSRLRARGEITEIRAKEMRFTLEEATAFLNDAMALALSPEDIAALEKRIEGWIVGLQLAALSMHQRADKDAFIQAFTGSHRYVVDYLVEEVLDRQTPEIRDFLLKTSILERLSGPICDAVLGGQNSQTVLIDLEQKNLFLIPLDEERRWYRYHQLFNDLLLHHLQSNVGEEVLNLHKKASIWYEENGLFADAVHHALATNEIERIVQLTDEMTVFTLNYEELKALLAWLERLPESSFSQYPWLLVTHAWALFNSGNYDAAEARLDDLDKILAYRSFAGELTNRVRGHAAAIRSYLAELREDPQSAMQQAEDSLAWLPNKDIHLRAFVAIRWANCLVWFGDLDRAVQVYREAGETSKLVGEGQLAITAFSEMAATQMIKGNLRQAVRSIAEITQYAETLTKRDGRQLPAVGILYRHMSYIKSEQNELNEAGYYASEALKVCKQWGEKESYLFALMALARVRYAQGDYWQVEQSFRNVIQAAREISPLYETQFKTWFITYQMLMGRLDEAEDWVQELGLSAGEIFGYNRHQEFYNYARFLLAQDKLTKALEVVDALLKVVNLVGAGMYTIRYKTLQAILLKKMGRMKAAMMSMEEALSRACTEGYVRSILDEGEEVGELLGAAISQGIEVEYAGKLFAALKLERTPSLSERDRSASLVDRLSSREMEVLRLFITDLTAPEIADELVISTSTVRSHIKNIYSKLDVHSRYEAVSKAKELNLF